MPPFTTSPVLGSIGIWPETKSMLPTFTACEYGPMGLGAASVYMTSFTAGYMLAVIKITLKY